MVLDVAILGGGLAGLASAVLLAKAGVQVEVFEQQTYPTHRVCGEYLSREVEPFLNRLGVNVAALGAKTLDEFELSTCGGQHFSCPLPGGGIGLSRYRLDQALAARALEAGATLSVGSAAPVVARPGSPGSTLSASSWSAQSLELKTPQRAFRARVVLGCFGKRSTLDRALARPSFKRRSPYVAVKRHFRGPFPQSLVGLHAIPGGYCGISPVEDDLVNVCYLTGAETLKQLGSVRGFNERGLHANPLLHRYLAPLTPATEALVVSQLDFDAKPMVSQHVLMLGDAAGSIHPLCGNGMAMALRAADLVAPLVLSFLSGDLSRGLLERRYTAAWRRAFRQRRFVGRWLQPLLESRAWSERACAAARRFPNITSNLIRRTHGQSF